MSALGRRHHNQAVVIEEEEEYEDFSFESVERDLVPFTWTQDAEMVHVVVPLDSAAEVVDESNLDCRIVDAKTRRLVVSIISPERVLVNISLAGSVDADGLYHEVLAHHAVVHVPKKSLVPGEQSSTKQWESVFHAPINVGDADETAQQPIGDELRAIAAARGVDLRADLALFKARFEALKLGFAAQKGEIEAKIGSVLVETGDDEEVAAAAAEAEAAASAAGADEDLAEELHKQALAMHLQGRPKDALRMYLRSAKLGNSMARNHLADILSSHTAGLYGTTTNVEQAMYYYQLAAFENGNVDAMSKLAQHWSATTVDDALALFAEAALLGDARAMMSISGIYQPNDEARAIAWAKLALNRGLVLAALQLGKLAEFGSAPEFVKALKYYKLAKFWSDNSTVADDHIASVERKLGRQPSAALSSAAEEATGAAAPAATSVSEGSGAAATPEEEFNVDALLENTIAELEQHGLVRSTENVMGLAAEEEADLAVLSDAEDDAGAALIGDLLAAAASAGGVEAPAATAAAPASSTLPSAAARKTLSQMVRARPAASGRGGAGFGAGAGGSLGRSAASQAAAARVAPRFREDFEDEEDEHMHMDEEEDDDKDEESDEPSRWWSLAEYGLSLGAVAGIGFAIWRQLAQAGAQPGPRF